VGRKIHITITVDADMYKEFKKFCEMNDIKVSTKINTLMREWLEENKVGDRLKC